VAGKVSVYFWLKVAGLEILALGCEQVQSAGSTPCIVPVQLAVTHAPTRTTRALAASAFCRLVMVHVHEISYIETILTTHKTMNVSIFTNHC